MEEYDYLEAQLNASAAPADAPVDENGKSSKREKKDKDKRRSGSRSRSRDRKTSRRSRSRSRSRDRRSRRDDRDRDRDIRPPRERDFRDRGRDRHRDFRPNRREPTPPHIRAEREREQEIKDMERAVRTVMVMNLNLRAVEFDIFEFFSQAGGIKDIKIICDKNTKKSKGIAYIEFDTVEGAFGALKLQGQLMMGMPVLVKPSEAEKNLAWEEQQRAKQNQASAHNLLNKMGGTAPGAKANPIKLQILNLHPGVGEEELKEIFQHFGEINYVKVVRDAAGVSTGEAYVQFADEPMALKAMKHFNGYMLADRQLTVQVAPLYTTSMLGGMLPPGALPGPPPVPGMPGAPMPAVAAAAAAASTIQAPPGMALPENTGGSAEVDDLDEAEKGAFRLNAQSRAALMSRLATSAGLQAPPSLIQMPQQQQQQAAPVLNVSQNVLLDQGLLGPASPIPTPCVLLKNMFSEEDKAEQNWEADVAEDVRSEAVKFGAVQHCYVDPSSQGHVYLKFSNANAAEAACKALHGRYYSGKQIVASFQFLQPYNNYFGL